MVEYVSVTCNAEPGKENLVPDWSTLTVYRETNPDNVIDRDRVLAWKTRGLGEMVALWVQTPGSEVDRTRIPAEVWVCTPGGPVQVDLRHVTFNGR